MIVTCSYLPWTPVEWKKQNHSEIIFTFQSYSLLCSPLRTSQVIAGWQHSAGVSLPPIGGLGWVSASCSGSKKKLNKKSVCFVDDTQ